MEGQHCLLIEWINPTRRSPTLRDVWFGSCVSQDLAGGDVGPACAKGDVLNARYVATYLLPRGAGLA